MFPIEDVDEPPEMGSERPVHGLWNTAKRFAALFFSETALKFYLFTYWLFCLFGMVEQQPHSVHVIKVMLVAIVIIFALLATVTRATCLFYPFLFVIMFEFTKHLAIFFLVALKLIFPERYNELISNEGLSRLRTFTKETRSDDELFYVWCGLCVIYFSLIGLTLIRNIIDYQWQEHLRQERRNFYPRLDTPILRGRIPPREIEVGSVNDDDPPPYSTIRNVSFVETTKEETNPPRYSQLELPLDYTKSSENSGNGSSDDCRTAISNTGSSTYNSRRLK